MRATIYYIELDDWQRAALNGGGWDSDIGRAYLTAKDGKLTKDNVHLFKKAATGDFADAENAWQRLQNLETPWSDDRSIECHTDFPRSMDVGDLIDWHQVEGAVSCVVRCASVGFTELTPADRELLNSHVFEPEEA